MPDPVDGSRRDLLKALGATAAIVMPQRLSARTRPNDLTTLRHAVDADYANSILRIQQWIGLPTIAAEHVNVDAGADFMAKLALDAGFQNVRKVPTGGIPAVFGTLDAGARHTLALYFMYDVKQFDAAEWTSPPLEGRVVDLPEGKAIRGRGANNQKGPEGAFLGALHAFRIAGRKPPVNLMLLAEGEEEIGSIHLANVFRDPDVLAAMRKSVGVIIPTNMQEPNGAMTIEFGAKGFFECELVSSGERWGKGPAQDIHSSYKAQVDSPVWHLVEALATLVSGDGNRPMIDGWFDRVRPMTAREEALISDAANARNEADTKRALGVKRWIDDLSWRASLERLVSQPTINIEGITAGYSGPGGKTVLPARASAKLDLRLVPNMTVADSVTKLKAHLERHGFGDIEVNVTGGYDPTETPEEASIMRAQELVVKDNRLPWTLFPRDPASWPGFLFTGPPLSRPASPFGLGYGGREHVADEFMIIESRNPLVAGLREQSVSYIEYMYAVATLS